MKWLSSWVRVGFVYSALIHYYMILIVIWRIMLLVRESRLEIQLEFCNFKGLSTLNQHATEHRNEQYTFFPHDFSEGRGKKYSHWLMVWLIWESVSEFSKAEGRGSKSLAIQSGELINFNLVFWVWIWNYALPTTTCSTERQNVIQHPAAKYVSGHEMGGGPGWLVLNGGFWLEAMSVEWNYGGIKSLISTI